MSGKTIIDNRKARHEFMFLEKYEVGIELRGTEVKSLRAGKGSLQDAYARIENGQLWLYNLHISAYAFGNINNHEEKRPRRLLLHKSEIARLYAAVREKGLTLVPVRLYSAARWLRWSWLWRAAKSFMISAIRWRSATASARLSVL